MKLAFLFGVLLGVLAVPAARPATADEPHSNPPPFSLYVRALRVDYASSFAASFAKYVRMMVAPAR